MTRWLKTTNEHKYGVAVYNYKDNGKLRLNLSIGDVVHIIEENINWYRGYNVRSKHVIGLFPKSYVVIRDGVVLNQGTQELIYRTEPPIVQEMTSVLQEWGAILKNLYVIKSAEFAEVRKIMLELIDKRKLIMSKKLPADELKVLQQKMASKIDLGNTHLGLDLVVRDEHGNMLDPKLTGCIKLYRQHESATQRIQRERRCKGRKELKAESVDSPGKFRHSSRGSYSLYICVRNVVCRIGEDADVLLSLYDAKACQFISESYVIKWGDKGLPKDIEMINNLRALFTDLGNRDLGREKIHLVCQISRIGCMDTRESDSGKRQTAGLKRPFGIAAMDITTIVKGIVENNEDKQHFVPFQACGEKEFMDSVMKKVLGAKEINHKGQGLWVSLQLLPGDLSQVREEYPHLVLGTTVIARKMGFPDVIMPGDVRNDIYVQLVQGEFNRGNKSLNVEITMVVCNKNGECIQDVVCQGAGWKMDSEYKSTVYYHEDKPKWCETVKVALPIEEFNGSHLKFLFRHRSSIEAKDRQEKPFAMSYVRLKQSNGTTLPDGIHELLVYKMSRGSKHDGIEGKKYESSIYLDLPSTRRELDMRGSVSTSLSKLQIQSGSLVYAGKDSFQISTLSVSTKLTHNIDLLGLLNWRDNTKGLKQHLQAIMKVDGGEIVKFLQDTLDALFNILMQHSESDYYDNLVFDALVFIIGLISDRKYNQFRPIMDDYIETEFSATLVYNKLINVLKFYVDRAEEKESGYQDNLLKALKSLEYVMKFITRSRLLFAALNEGRGKQQFEVALKQLFEALNILMLYTSNTTVLQQGAALKYLPTTIPFVMNVFDPQELSLILVEFINNVPKDRLTKQKMQCINDIVHSKMFLLVECRVLLMPMIMTHIHELLEEQEETEICISILSDILDILFSTDVVSKGSVYNDVGTILFTNLRTLIKTVFKLDRGGPHIAKLKRNSSISRAVERIRVRMKESKPLSIDTMSVKHGPCVSVVISILHQMTDDHYQQFINSFQAQRELMDFLMEILMVIRDLVSRNIYPFDWNEMIMIQNSVFLKTLQSIAKTLRDKFYNPFEIQLWNNFFHCAISFLTQENLQLENFTGLKRSKIINRYKDMRRVTAFEIRSIWFNLGHNKCKFIPNIVGPILEMTLIPEIELRKATIPIFFDMMQCEFNQPGQRAMKGNFIEFEDEMIQQLDVLIEGGRGDEAYAELFHAIMYNQLANHSTMRDQGLPFVETVKRLMQHLLEYRSVMDDEIKENRMNCIVNLLNFYHEINRQEMYIRYLHKLCDLHLECDNYTEAAHTLVIYARLLKWSDDVLSQILQSDKYPECQTHRELKERLYYDVIGYFDKGKMWEKGLELCKELSDQYENETFNYSELSKLLDMQSQFYRNIMQLPRPEPEYFRVGFYGKGFPSFLQNKMFVYRGKEYERLSDFTARLQNQFTDAQLLKTLSEPSDEVLESKGQYLQINAVTPVLELQKKFHGKAVRNQIIKYFKVNEVQKFTFSKMMDGAGDVTDMWLERTNLTVLFPLPGILRNFPVKKKEVFMVSPLEVAIETIETANERMRILIEQHQNVANLAVDPLGMLLNGIVDPAVNGGISKYKYFYSDEYYQANPGTQTKELIRKLREVTAKQVNLLFTGITIHGMKVVPSLRPLHEHMVQSFDEMKSLMEKEYSIRVKPTPEINLKRVKTMPAQSTSEQQIPSIVKRSSVGMRRRGSSFMLSISSDRSVEKVSQGAQRHQSVWVKPSSEKPQVTRSNSPNKTTKLLTNAIQAFGRSRPLSTEFKQDKQEKEEDRDVEEEEAKKKERSSKFHIHLPNHQRGSKSDMQNINTPKIELTEQLTPQRPRRPDADKRLSRPGSQHFKYPSSPGSSERGGSLTPTSISSTGSDHSPLPDDVPPPLPQKQAYADYQNLADMVGDEPPPLVPKRVTSFPSSSNGPDTLRESKPVPPLPGSAQTWPERTASKDENDLSPSAPPPALPQKRYKSRKTIS
ncbi:dedicator of cytokinesis protein 1-like isoform X3 [Lineus longissimus]|uniref:dedicator of cytokinesis protein 1-like isoform X3 n=1 Tax=Lineus longissimus TaxID=88925 RepID=UPI00315DA0DA